MGCQNENVLLNLRGACWEASGGQSGHCLGCLCYQELSLCPLAGALPRSFPCAYVLSQVLTLAGAQALPGEAQNGKLKPHSGKMKALRAGGAVPV